MKSKHFHGLREGIKFAASTREISDLLTIGSQFQQASPKTIRRWNRTAVRRQVELQKETAK